MKRLDASIIGMVLFVFVAAVILGGGSGAKADFVFGTPTNLGPIVNGADDVGGVSVSADGLELYFVSDRPGGYGSYDLWVATRHSTDDDWSAPVNLGPTVNSPYPCMTPSISADGLQLFFSDSEYGPFIPGGVGSTDTWMVTRETKDAAWNAPVNLGSPVNYYGGDISPNMSADGLSLYFARGTGPERLYDLRVAKRSTTDDQWSTPADLGPTVNSTAAEIAPSISADGLALFFCRTFTGQSDFDLWITTRATEDDEWGLPVKLVNPVNTSAVEAFPSISADGSTLYFCSDRAGGFGQWDIWQAPIIPILDFNGDGKVDGKDVLIMAEHWAQADTLCDIGPMPWGDGVVDVKDLIVLAGYIGKEVVDHTLVAHWALDEKEGTVAHDSAGKNDGSAVGNLAWQPAGGKVGGALAFDGKDDFVRSQKSVLDPAAGPFSVIAWVKGGATGRVIVSQASGADWLYLNQYGMLTTDLKSSGRHDKSLTSDAFMIDDQWHRVVLTWDGMNRSLYMDGIKVATDTQPSLTPSSGNLQIGCGRGGGAFWSGLIDDVRLYNRAVQP